MRGTSRWARHLFVPVLVMLQAACATTLTPIPVTDLPVDGQTRATVLVDGQTVELWELWVQNDTILGGRRPNDGGWLAGRTLQVPFSDVVEVSRQETRRSSAGKGALIGVGAGYVLAAAFASCGECDGVTVGGFFLYGSLVAATTGLLGALIGWAAGR